MSRDPEHLADQSVQLGFIFDMPQHSSPVPPSLLAPAVATVVYDTYWRFAVERQNIFFRRFAGDSPPFSRDQIMQQYKFTNAYRASDRVSQYLIQTVIYGRRVSIEDLFFRILLFKLFNRIETWELLDKTVGPILWSEYDFRRYDRILSNALQLGRRIYSAAYIMPSALVFGSARKHRNHLRLLEAMMSDEVPLRISALRSMRAAFELLRSYPSIGDFLAYQLVTDLNYSDLTDFTEMEFVMPGPGAKDGMRKCFASLGGLTEADMIRVVADRQAEEFERLGLTFRSLWGRSLQLIDCQNLFCEVDKYARLAHPDVKGWTGRTRIKQKYRVPREPMRFWYPPKWGLNDVIDKQGGIDCVSRI